MAQQYKIRQPIITIAGHVDHGKTTILDSIRRTAIAEAEAGGITQKISFTLFPANKIIGRCPLIEKSGIKLEIPGFLFVDTPGHAAFTNLRKRGGSLADVAILVIDINEGIKPQTAEVIEILKQNKTPFVIALNKLDRISGWRKQSEDLKQSIEIQAQNVKQEFQEKILTLQGTLHTYGFESDLFYEVKDFTTRIALVPCSGKTGEGIPEILMMLCGLSQKFLKGRLSLGQKAKGVILEIKKEKSMNYIEAILHDGVLKRNNEIAIASFDKTITSRIRTLEEILPLSNKFKPVYSARAATGIRMQLTTSEEILSGMPFQTFKNQQEIEKLSKEVRDRIRLDKQGIIVKADSLGSLEALLLLLRQENIKVSKAGIGSINKSDIISAQANLEKNPINAIVVGFNTYLDQEAKEFSKNIKQIKILEDDVIYKLIENLQEFQEQKQKQIEKEKLMSLASICKLKILHQHVFRNSSPAIFGVSVQGGTLKKRIKIINERDEEIGKIKTLQSKGSTLDKAEPGEEVAISIPNTNFERKIKDSSILYSDISERQFRQFKDNKELLSPKEISVLQEIAQIKRTEKPTWGI
jgi:translation initiation factor 5B